MGQKLEVIQGTAGTFQGVAMQEDGITPFTGYSSGDPITVQLWAGGDQSPISPAPVGSWIDATQGSFIVRFSEAITAALPVGIYQFLPTVLHGGSTYALSGPTSLSVIAGPGSSATRPTYCDLKDLQALLSNVQDVFDKANSLAGFLDKRAEARIWFDDAVIRHYRSDSLSVNAYPCSRGWGGYQRTGATNQWLKQYLDNNKLMVTENVKVCNALYALALICGSQLLNQTDNDYAKLGNSFLGRAQSRLASITAEVDINDDGYADLVIDLGASDMLWS